MRRLGRASGWLPAGVLILLLGILGMHALGPNGDPASSTTPPSPSVAHLHEAAAGVGHLVLPQGAEAGRQLPTGDQGEHALHAMAGLCLAFLAAGLISLVARLVRRRRRFWAVMPTTAPAALLRASCAEFGDTSPPYVWEYSVIRC